MILYSGHFAKDDAALMNLHAYVVAEIRTGLLLLDQTLSLILEQLFLLIALHSSLHVRSS